MTAQEKSGGLDEVQRYLFDTQGYLVLEDVLTTGEVARLLDALPRTPHGRPVPAENEGTFRGLLENKEPLFRGLIDHPRVVPILSDLFGGSAFYLDHEYGLHFRKGDDGIRFHNGGTPFDPWCSYQIRDGTFHCGLVAVIWALTEVGPGDGGFMCVPGSHQANFPLPKSIETKKVVPTCVVQPPMKAGSVLIFTEALTHGTRAWTADHDRTALFFKYMPDWIACVGKRPPELRKVAAPDWLGCLKPRSRELIQLATPEQREMLIPER